MPGPGLPAQTESTIIFSNSPNGGGDGQGVGGTAQFVYSRITRLIQNLEIYGGLNIGAVTVESGEAVIFPCHISLDFG